MATPMNKVVSSQVIDDILVAQIMVPQMRDIELVQRVKDELIEAIQEGNPRAIILDLSQLEFIGSVGFLAFLAARRTSNANQIVLCNLSERTHEVFALCRLIPHAARSDTPFAVQATVESALASLKGE
jgi:anti-anti-sigma factor